MPKSPSSEYMQQVFLPLCEKIGLPKVDVNVIQRGWTTGAPEIGEVEISVSHPRAPREEDTQNEITASTRGTTVEGEKTLRKIVKLILVGLTGAGRGKCCGRSSRDSSMHISLKVETTE